INLAKAEEGMKIMADNGVTFAEVDRQPFIDVMTAYFQSETEAGNLPPEFLEAVEATRAQ
ncbi:hypothetical protein MHN28_24500, partial [Ruegeria sp. Ofav3-42]|nr:hypothetical protein [Ruegeria sp. Ofav3-42]